MGHISMTELLICNESENFEEFESLMVHREVPDVWTEIGYGLVLAIGSRSDCRSE